MAVSYKFKHILYLRHNPAAPLLGCLLKRNEVTYLYKILSGNVYSSFIHNHWKLDVDWINKLRYIHPCNGMLLSNEKEQKLLICSAIWMNLKNIIKEAGLMFIYSMIPSMWHSMKYIGTEVRSVIAMEWDWGRWLISEACLKWVNLVVCKLYFKK